MIDKPHIQLDCPTCGNKVNWSDDFPFRPFCSKRCQQIDFGNWAMEKNAIPGDSVPEGEDESGDN